MKLTRKITTTPKGEPRKVARLNSNILAEQDAAIRDIAAKTGKTFTQALSAIISAGLDALK